MQTLGDDDATNDAHVDFKEELLEELLQHFETGVGHLELIMLVIIRLV